MKISEAGIHALKWMQSHGGDAAMVRVRGGGLYALAQGESGPFLPTTRRHLIDLGLAEYVDIGGKKSVRFRLTEKGKNA